MNIVILQGNLTKENEMRYMQNGTAICSNSIEVTKKWKDKQGNTQEKVLFVDIVIFRGAETFNQYTQKGHKILIRGSLELDTWQDNNGNNRQKHKVNVEEFEFIQGKEKSKPEIKVMPKKRVQELDVDEDDMSQEIPF